METKFYRFRLYKRINVKSIAFKLKHAIYAMGIFNQYFVNSLRIWYSVFWIYSPLPPIP